MCEMDKLTIYILISFIPTVLLVKTPLNTTTLLMQAKPVEEHNLDSEMLPVKNNSASKLVIPEPYHHHIIGKTGVSVVTDATHLSREHVTKEIAPKSPSSHEHITEDKSSKQHTNHGGSHEHDGETKSSEIQSNHHQIKGLAPSPNVLNASHTVHGIVSSKTNVTQANMYGNQTSTHSSTTSSTTILSIIVNRTTVKPVPTKPTRPVPEDINFILASKNAEHYAPCLDANDSRQTKTSDIVVLVVAVIFSVPLIAIVVSVLYKKWTDWWQHRNYRRMDFLIEGMYNN